jgi:hypothetical protein
LAIAAGLVVAVAAFWTLPARPPRSTSVSPSPLPALPAPAPTPSPAPRRATATPPGPAASRVVLALSPVLLRGEGRPPELRIPKAADTVVLELQGDPAVLPPPASALEVTVETVEGGPVWRGEARRATDGHAPSRLASAAVPTAVLGAGDYLVTLSAPGKGGATLYRYFVRVVP